MSESVRRPPDEHEAAWRRNFWIILILFGVSVVALLLLLATLGILWNSLRTTRESARPVPRGVPAALSTSAPLPVAVVPARIARATTTVLLPGYARAGEQWYVAAPASGRVARVLAAPGARVAAGQAVARIATSVPVARPARASGRRWVTRPPSSAAVAARGEAVRAAEARLARAESAVRAAEGELAAAREARARAQSAREAARQDVGEAEALLTRARAELASQDAAVRQVENLYQSGAASRTEVSEDRSARSAASDRLTRAQARAQAARSAAGAAEAGVTRGDAAIGAAQDRLTHARSEVGAAREAARVAERAPVPQPEVVPISVESSSSGWSVVSTFADARAPAAGVVTTLLAGPGTYVSRGHALMRVTRPSGRRYRVEGPADQLRGVRPGMPARLRAPDGAPVPARVSAVFLSGPSPSGGGAGGRGPRRRVAVEVVADGAPPRRAPGSVSVELSVTGPATSVTVPARAVCRAPSGVVVWVTRRTGKKGADTIWIAQRRTVRVGPPRNGQVEIRAGLQPGSQVIVAGMEKLRDGQTVAAVPWSLP